jgi:hypothetical protein
VHHRRAATRYIYPADDLGLGFAQQGPDGPAVGIAEPVSDRDGIDRTNRAFTL